MSNVYTEFARLYLRPDVRLTPVEVEPLLDRILGERGSYWVPVWYDISAGSHVDLQYGSGKSAGRRVLVAFEEGTQAQWLHDLIAPQVERVVVSISPRADRQNQIAASLVSPVRMRTTCSTETTKILPSPILPVRAALTMASSA